MGCGLLYFGVLSYAFACVGRFPGSWKQAIGNGLAKMMKKPGWTILLLAVNAAVVFVCYLAWIWAFPAVVLLFCLRAVILCSAFGDRRLPDEDIEEKEIYYE